MGASRWNTRPVLASTLSASWTQNALDELLPAAILPGDASISWS